MSTSAHLIRPTTIWTIGHSTRPLEEFLALLAASSIEAIADVRSFPASRKFPQYGKEALAATLARHATGYHWLPALGGRRRTFAGSPNTAWRNASFRGYADYMASAQFAQGLSQLIEMAAHARTAVMCAEAVWWRCHRSLISDYLKANGVVVSHILSATKTEPHPYTSAARIVDGELSYRGLF